MALVEGLIGGETPLHLATAIDHREAVAGCCPPGLGILIKNSPASSCRFPPGLSLLEEMLNNCCQVMSALLAGKANTEKVGGPLPWTNGLQTALAMWGGVSKKRPREES